LDPWPWKIILTHAITFEILSILILSSGNLTLNLREIIKNGDENQIE
jgi:hypothetical protein